MNRKNCGDGMVLVDDCTFLQQMADEQDDCKPLPM